VIARVWTGAVRKEDGDSYAEYMRETAILPYATTPGNRGVWMLRRDVHDRFLIERELRATHYEVAYAQGSAVVRAAYHRGMARAHTTRPGPELARWNPRPVRVGARDTRLVGALANVRRASTIAAGDRFWGQVREFPESARAPRGRGESDRQNGVAQGIRGAKPISGDS
jgi:hypothetical protein